MTTGSLAIGHDHTSAAVLRMRSNAGCQRSNSASEVVASITRSTTLNADCDGTVAAEQNTFTYNHMMAKTAKTRRFRAIQYRRQRARA